MPPPYPELKGLPHPFGENDYDDGYKPKTLVELRLISLVNSILLKPEWATKLSNPEIQDKWIAEAKAQGITDDGVAHSFDMLAYRAKQEEERRVSDNQSVPPTSLAIQAVSFADGVVDSALRSKLREVARPLEDVPDEEKDWHPGSNGLVLDLVHPSLYCYVDQVSRVIDMRVARKRQWYEIIGGGKPKHLLGKVNDNDYATSKRFQWLPSEFRVHADGTVAIRSYINNLHPRHKELYATVAKIFEKFVPLFNDVLTDCLQPVTNIINCDGHDWYDKCPYELSFYEIDSEGIHTFRNPTADEEEKMEEWCASRKVNQPAVPKFQPRKRPRKVVDLNGKDLQVIVKLGNIQLTPDKPRYEGGVWHVEGMANESIVATGIYYYDVANITESRLSFRVDIHEPSYEQEDRKGVREIFGLEDEGPLNQIWGSLTAAEDRCIAFANMYQHKVEPFELEDASRPGHRKILVFFLVDPSKRILSTMQVSPQQRDWYAPELLAKKPFSALPNVVVDRVSSSMDWPMGREQAEKYRTELMAERKYFIGSSDERKFERPFSLCEH